ncbi:MAG: DUF5667 domain-containing protein [Dehalococcoidales bacterium]|nr:DUF5667 domain-containing protein [Dehalococcoidales bacterium]
MSRKEEILAECIEEVQQGRSTVEDCLRRYPELSSELKTMLELVQGIKTANVSPTPEFRRRLRSRLFEETAPAKAKIAKESGRGWFISLLSVRAAATGLMALVVLAGGTGSVYAAQSSLPGDVLYQVKIGVENVQVAVTRDPEQRAYLYLKLAQRRIDEVAAELSLNRTPSASALAAVPEKTDAALREIEKAPSDRAGAFLSRFAETTANQQIALGTILNANNQSGNAMQQTMTSLQRANLIADTAFNNTAFLETNPSVRDNMEKGRFQVEGALLSISGKNWNVGGVVLANVNFSGDIPPVNSQLQIDAINKNNEVYIIDLEIKSAPQPAVTVQGQFTGTDKSGKVWYVGDTPIDAPEGKTPPAEGKNLEVKGVTSNNSLSVKDVKETGDQGKGNGQAQLEGKLDSVNAAKKTIVIKVAGAGISIDISSTTVYDKNGKQISLSELASNIGKRIKVNGMSKKGGTNYAKEIRIDTD